MKFPCSGVILAGGLNSRFSGTSKAFLQIGNKRIIDNIFSIFNDLFDEIILITNSPLQYLEWNVMIASDIFPVRSSLTGIHTGLFYATHPFAFFAASDTPFLKKELIQTVLDNIEPQFDVIVPETSTGFEPLCAVYSKQALATVENRLMRQEFKIRRIFQSLRVKKIPEDVLRKADPELISFFNVNTPEDLAKAESLLKKT